METISNEQHDVKTPVTPGNQEVIAMQPFRGTGIDLSSPLDPEREVIDKHGQPRSVDIYAEIADAESEKVYVLFGYSHEGEETFGVGELNSSNGDESQPTLVGEFFADYSDSSGKFGRKDKRITRGEVKTSKDRSIVITISPEDASATIEAKYISEDDGKEAMLLRYEDTRKAKRAERIIEKRNKESDRRPQKKYKRIGIAALSMLGITSPDGPADMVMDHFHNPDGVVEHVVESAIDRASITYDMGTGDYKGQFRYDVDLDTEGARDIFRGDGVHKSVNFDPDNHVTTIQLTDGDPHELAAKIDARNADIEGKFEEAGDRLGEILNALDDHDKGLIETRANEFRNAYEHNMPTAEEVVQTIEKIENAESSSAVIEAANEFLSRYGVTVSALESKQADEMDKSSFDGLTESSIGGLKSSIESVIELASLFPDSKFSDIFGVKRIKYGNRVDDGSGKTNQIGFAILEGVEVYMGVGFDSAERLYRSVDLEDTTWHEIFHTALGPHFEDIHGDESLATDTLRHLASKFTGRPEFSTFYAVLGDSYEEFAETGVDVIEKGLPHPDQAYRFDSRANVMRLKIFLDLESKIPGITSHIVDSLGQQETGAFDAIKGVESNSEARKIISILFALMVYRNRRSGVYSSRKQQRQ